MGGKLEEASVPKIRCTQSTAMQTASRSSCGVQEAGICKSKNSTNLVQKWCLGTLMAGLNWRSTKVHFSNVFMRMLEHI